LTRDRRAKENRVKGIAIVLGGLSHFWKLSRFVYIKQTINFDEINISNRHVYYPVNTCVKIALISILIDGFSRTNIRAYPLARREPKRRRPVHEHQNQSNAYQIQLI